MKKIFSLIIIGIFLISLAGTISAINQETYNQMNFFDRIKYEISSGKLFGLFTAWGEANCCSTDPDKEAYIGKGSTVKCSSYCSSKKCAVDIWYDKTLYLGGSNPLGDDPVWSSLVYVEEVSGEGASWTAPSSHDYWYYQVYCCPSSCQTPTHSTRAYKCENHQWVSKGYFDSDEYCSYDTSGVHLCWCDDEDEKYYIDQSGNVHCRSSPQSSWCPSYTSHYSKACYNGNIYWYDSDGQITDLYQTCSYGCLGGVCKSAPTTCETMSGTSGKCDSNAITDKKCIGNLVYICSDYGTAGKCWTNMADCSASGKICSNGECTSSCISRTELGTYIDSWIAGTITRDVLGNHIMSWANNCN